MSTPEAPIPKKFWAMVHWTVQNHPWIFFLVSVERLAEGHLQQAAIFASIFVANLFVASRWDEIGGYAKGRRKMLPFIALGALGCLFVGISVGALWRMGVNGQTSRVITMGRIDWNFDQAVRGEAIFLSSWQIPGQERHIVGIGFHGKNTSPDAVVQFNGYVQSDLTNARLPLLFMAQESGQSNAQHPSPLFQPDFVPTKPNETYGIPGLAEFDVVTHETATLEVGQGGTLESVFLRNFGSFTVVVEYDNQTYSRKFSREEIMKQLEMINRGSNPGNNPVPRITRLPTASSPIYSQPFLQLNQQQPALAASPPIPPSPAPSPSGKQNGNSN